MKCVIAGNLQYFCVKFPQISCKYVIGKTLFRYTQGKAGRNIPAKTVSYAQRFFYVSLGIHLKAETPIHNFLIADTSLYFRLTFHFQFSTVNCQL